MTKIIGICGPQRAGKSTLAHKAAKHMGNAGVVSFASPLREIAKILVGEEVIKDKHYSPFGLTGRQILQRLGTEIGRNLSDRVWIDCMARQSSGLSAAVIDDVRFINEAAECRALIWVEDADAAPVIDEHASEADQCALRDSANVRLVRRGAEYFCDGKQVNAPLVIAMLAAGL